MPVSDVRGPSLQMVSERLAGRAARQIPDDETREAGARRAAVAIVLRHATGTDPDELELLLIRRAEHAGDPWSGHVALPGGREESADRSLEDTAVRETLEETGLDLRKDGRILGVLDELHPRSAPVPVLVRPYVAWLDRVPSLTLSDEVASALWVPLATLTAPDAAVESTVHARGTPRAVRSYRYGEYVVWGMTERILRNLVALVAPAADASA